MRLSQEARLSSDDEEKLKFLYDTYSEKDRRRLVAFEAGRLPHGGIEYIASVVGCHVRTVRRGIKELESLRDDDPVAGRVRREGAGRPKKAMTALKSRAN